MVTMNICFELLFIALAYYSLPLLCGEHRPVFCMVIFFFFLLCRIEQE